MEVYPLSFTLPNWQSFIDVCHKVKGCSSTRGHDVNGLNVQNVAAFLACLDLKNNPTNALRYGLKNTNIGKHVNLGFIAIVDEDLVEELQQVCCVPLTVFPDK